MAKSSVSFFLTHGVVGALDLGGRWLLQFVERGERRSLAAQSRLLYQTKQAAAVLTAKSRIAAATYNISTARQIYFILGGKCPPKLLPLPEGIRAPV